MDGYITIMEAMKLLSPHGVKTKPVINGYCKNGKIPTVMNENKWYISVDYIKQALTWRIGVLSLKEIVASSHCSIDKDIEKSRNILSKITIYKAVSNEYSILFSGILISPDKKDDVLKIVMTEIEWNDAETNSLSISEAAKLMGKSRYQVMEMIKKGTIKGFLSKNCWYITFPEVENYTASRDRYVSVYEMAKSIAEGVNTMFDIDNRTDRAQLNAFLVTSEASVFLLTWEDVGFRDDRRNSLYLPCEYKEVVEKIISEYIERFGKKAEKLVILEMDSYWEQHPITKKILDEFSDKKTDIGMAALYEILIRCVDVEIIDCENKDIERMREYAENAPTLIYTQYLVMFVNYVRKNYRCIFTIELLVSRKKKRVKADNVKPYTISEYFKMAYMVFNDEYINPNQSVIKAINNAQDAYVWLFTSMHYSCAWC